MLLLTMPAQSLAAVENASSRQPSPGEPNEDCPTVEACRLWKEFKARYGQEWQVRWNEYTGAPEKIYGGYYQLAVGNITSKEKALEIAWKFISDNKDFLKVNPADLRLLEVQEPGLYWGVTYKQYYKGIPVREGGRVELSFTKKGELLTAGSTFHPDINVPTTPEVSKGKAIEIAKRRMATESPWVEDVSLEVLPYRSNDTITYHLAWEVELFNEAPFLRRVYFIDAIDGGIIKERDTFPAASNMQISGTVSGPYYYYERPNDAPTPYNLENLYVYIKDKDFFFDDVLTTVTTNSNGFYDTGQISNIGDTGVDDDNILDPEAEVYVYSEFSALHVQIFDYVPLLPDNKIEHSSPNFGHVSTSITHNWNASGWKINGNPVPVEIARDVQNVYYHTRIAHDYFTGRPFNHPSFQIQAHVDVDGLYNAYCVGDNDMGFGNEDPVLPGTRRGVWARSSDVIYHEYTHCIINQIYDAEEGIPDISDTDEARALNEGIPDYFAATLNNDPMVGEQVLPDVSFLNIPTYPPLTGDVDRDSGIISGTLWSIREDIGQSVADRLIYEAMKLPPKPTTFQDFYENILVMDDRIYGNDYLPDGTPHACEISEAFFKHGMYYDAPLGTFSLPGSLECVIADGQTRSTKMRVEGRPSSMSIELDWWSDDELQLRVEDPAGNSYTCDTHSPFFECEGPHPQRMVFHNLTDAQMGDWTIGVYGALIDEGYTSFRLESSIIAGGIDFTRAGVSLSSLELGYLSACTDGRGLPVALKGKKAEEGEDLIDPEAERDKILRWFLTGLVVPDHLQWVSMDPPEPYDFYAEKGRVTIDPELAKTDLGRTLLEADVELKKMFASREMTKAIEESYYEWDRMIQGAPYYDKLRSEGWYYPLPLWRVWITHGNLTAKGDGCKIFIEDHTLDMDFQVTGVYLDFSRYGLTRGEIEDLKAKLEAWEAYHEDKVRQLVVPEELRRINNGPEFQGLRSALTALAVAQWYKTLDRSRLPFAYLLDTNNVTGLESEEPYDPDYWEDKAWDPLGGLRLHLPSGDYTLSIRGGIILSAISPEIIGGMSPEEEALMEEAIKATYAKIGDTYYFGGEISVPAPDILPAGVWASKARPEANQTVAISTAIRNRGDMDARGFDVYFYDRYTRPDGSTAIAPIGYKRVQGLKAGEGIMVTVEWNPGGMLGGHEIYVEADHWHEVDEADERNNLGGINITVVTPYPNATILSPSTGRSFLQDDIIGFKASAYDPQDGVLDGEELVWTSSIDGLLGTGSSLEKTRLSPGVHRITLTATDSDGNKDRVQISITVNPSQPPAVSITSPTDGQRFAQGEAIYLTGSAEDAEDGELPDTSMTWASSIDGLLGRGRAISTSQLSVGDHTITLTAVDSTGMTSTAEIGITIEYSTPTATITSPSEGQEFFYGGKVELTGSGVDPHEGVLPDGSLGWYSSIDGYLGTGGRLAVYNLSSGHHTITLVAVDSQGLRNTDEVEIRVHPPYSPSASIISPADGEVFSYGETVHFKGSGVDPEDGELAGSSLTWYSSIDGYLGTGGSLSRSDLSVGVHRITLTVVDSMGLNTSVETAITVKPRAEIASPKEGEIFSQEDAINFSGLAPGIADGSFTWASNIDGLLGEGRTLTRTNLTPGTHRITLTVSNGRGLNGTASVDIIVVAPSTVLLNTLSDGSREKNLSFIGDLAIELASISTLEDGARKKNLTFIAPTAIVPGQLNTLSDGSAEKDLTYTRAGNQMVYLTIPKEASARRASLDVSGISKSETQNSFSDGASEETLTFDSAGDKYVYLKIPLGANVTEATLRIGGKTNSEYRWNWTGDDLGYSRITYGDGGDTARGVNKDKMEKAIRYNDVPQLYGARDTTRQCDNPYYDVSSSSYVEYTLEVNPSDISEESEYPESLSEAEAYPLPLLPSSCSHNSSNCPSSSSNSSLHPARDSCSTSSSNSTPNAYSDSPHNSSHLALYRYIIGAHGHDATYIVYQYNYETNRYETIFNKSFNATSCYGDQALVIGYGIAGFPDYEYTSPRIEVHTEDPYVHDGRVRIKEYYSQSHRYCDSSNYWCWIPWKYYCAGNNKSINLDYKWSYTCFYFSGYKPWYPQDPYLDVGDDSDTEWSYSGRYKTTQMTDDFKTEINKYLAAHQEEADADGNILVPIKVHSDSRGKLVLSSLDITYKAYPVNPSLDVGGDGDIEWSYPGIFKATQTTPDFSGEINDFLGICTPDEDGNCTVPLTLRSDSSGVIRISGIDVQYEVAEPLPPPAQVVYLELPKDAWVIVARIGLSGYPYLEAYPSNVSLNVGNDSDIEWSYTGALVEAVTTPDLSDEINEYLGICTPDEDGNCTVPLVFTSDSAGVIEVSGIDIEYRTVETLLPPTQDVYLTIPKTADMILATLDLSDPPYPGTDPLASSYPLESELQEDSCLHGENASSCSLPPDLWISNGQIGIDLHLLGSTNFQFPLGTHNLDFEMFGVRYNGTFKWAWDFDIIEWMHFITDTPEKKIAVGRLSDGRLMVEMRATLLGDKKWILIEYRLENLGNGPLTLSFYQPANFDVDHTRRDDRGAYDLRLNMVYQWDSDGYPYVGFASLVPSSEHEVNDYGWMWSNVMYDRMRGDNSCSGDCGVALKWDVTLDPGGDSVIPIIFGAGTNETDLKEEIEDGLAYSALLLVRVANPSLDVGGDGDVEWRYTGELMEKVTTPDLSGEIAEHLSTCPPVNRDCVIPLVFQSDTSGVLKISNINVQYLIFDRTPPTIHGVSVTPSPIWPGRAMTIRANITDNVGVEEVKASLDSLVVTLTYNPRSGLYEGTMTAPSPGNYSLTITARDPANLTSTRSTSVLVRSPTFDFVVTDIAYKPAQPREGDMVTIEATVTDMRIGGAIYILVGFQIDGVLQERKPVQVPAGATVTTSFKWEAVYGEHEIAVIADLDGISEYNETNNRASRDIFVSDATPPVIYGIAVDPDPSYPGGLLTVTAGVVDNVGVKEVEVAVEGVTQTLAYNPDTGLYEGKTAAPSEPGVYSIRITALDTNGLASSKQALITVNPVGPDLALAPADISFAPIIADGDVATIGAEIYNIGWTDADNFYVEFSVDGVTQETRRLSIPAGSSKTMEFAWKAVYGGHEITVTADSTDVVAEWNETNNRASKTVFVVDATPPTIHGMAFAPSTVREGEALRILANITDNIGVAEVEVRIGETEIPLAYNPDTGLYEGTTTAPEAGVYLVRAAAVDLTGLRAVRDAPVEIRRPTPDLVVASTDVLISPLRPMEDDTIIINATIRNAGGGDADSFDVEFSVDGVVEDVTTISIPAGHAETLQFLWAAVYGEHTLTVTVDPDDRVEEIDEANNAYARALLVSDATPPTVTGLKATPSSWTTSTAPMVSWEPSYDKNGIERYEYRIDYGEWRDAGVSTSLVTPPLSDGVHVVYVRAVDKPGNVGPPANVSVYIDTSPPGTPVIKEWHSGGTWTGHSSPYFSWTDPGDRGSGIAYYMASVDNQTPVDIGGIFYYHPTWESGIHTFKIYAVDALGQRSDWSNMVTVYIDTLPPPPPNVTSPTHPKDRWYSIDTPVFNWTTPWDHSGISGYYYLVDASNDTLPDALSRWTSNNSVEIGGLPGMVLADKALILDLSDGVWYFHIVSKDRAGNIGGSAAHYRVKIDTTPPIINIATPREGEVVRSGTPLINATLLDAFSEVNTSTVVIRLDGAMVNATVMPAQASYTPLVCLADGSHTVAVEASDLAGNTANASRSFTVMQPRVDAWAEEAANATYDGAGSLVGSNVTGRITLVNKENFTIPLADIFLENIGYTSLEEEILRASNITAGENTAARYYVNRTPRLGLGLRWNTSLDGMIRFNWTEEIDFKLVLSNPSPDELRDVHVMIPLPKGIRGVELLNVTPLTPGLEYDVAEEGLAWSGNVSAYEAKMLAFRLAVKASSREFIYNNTLELEFNALVRYRVNRTLSGLAIEDVDNCLVLEDVIHLTKADIRLKEPISILVVVKNVLAWVTDEANDEFIDDLAQRMPEVPFNKVATKEGFFSELGRGFYNILFLANTDWPEELTEPEIEEIKGIIHAGGPIGRGLIMSGFALKYAPELGEVLGDKYIGSLPMGEPFKIKPVTITEDHPITQGYVGQTLNSTGWTVRVVPEASMPLAYLEDIMPGRARGKPSYLRELPAITVSAYGNGSSVLFAPDIGASAEEELNREEWLDLASRAIEWISTAEGDAAGLGIWKEAYPRVITARPSPIEQRRGGKHAKVKVEVTIRNTGQLDLFNVNITEALPEGLLLANGTLSLRADKLEVGEEVALSYSLRVPATEEASYELLTEVTAVDSRGKPHAFNKSLTLEVSMPPGLDKKNSTPSLRLAKSIKPRKDCHAEITIGLLSQGNTPVKAVLVKEYIPRELAVKTFDGVFTGYGLMWVVGVVEHRETIAYTIRLPEVEEPATYELKTVVEYQTPWDLEVVEKTAYLTLTPGGKARLDKGRDKRSVKARGKGYARVYWGRPNYKGGEGPQGKKKGIGKGKGKGKGKPEKPEKPGKPGKPED
jgi:subtilase family serine protease